ncbi:hypothetical protein ACFQ60_04080 [Streptomyces zhihengii]
MPDHRPPRCGRRHHHRAPSCSRAGETFLLAQPDRPCTGELCAARCTVTLFDPGLLDQVAEGAVPSGGPVRFTGQQPVDAAANRSLGVTVSFLRDHVLAGPDGNNLVVETAVRHLAAVTLSALPNTTMDDGLGWPGNHDAGPETLRRATAFIEDNAHRDIGLADIAAAVFVTPALSSTRSAAMPTPPHSATCGACGFSTPTPTSSPQPRTARA